MRKQSSTKKKRKNNLTASDIKLGLEALLAEVQKPESEQDSDIGKKIKKMWTDKMNGSGSDSIH